MNLFRYAGIQYDYICMVENEKLRIDKYLWSIRLFKTRSLAAEACHAGKVKRNGNAVKAAANVAVGDKYEVKSGDKKWIIEVTGLLHSRVKYEEAIKHYADLTPEKKPDEIQSSSFIFNTGKRKSKQGRPTKKDKRMLDDFFD